MNAIIKISITNCTAWFDYGCQECGVELDYDEKKDCLWHPTNTGAHWKSTCQFSGRAFKRPVQALQLEEVKDE